MGYSLSRSFCVPCPSPNQNFEQWEARRMVKRFLYALFAVLLLGVPASGEPVGEPGQLKDINPDAASSFPEGFTNVGRLSFFAANTNASGIELWRTNGTPTGTRMV